MTVSETQDLKLRVTEERIGSVLLYELAGSLEVGNVSEAKALLESAWAAPAPKILFDVSQVEYIDSAGLGFLIGSLRRAVQAGGTLKVCGLSAYLTGIFKIVNLQNILEVFEDRETAIEAYQ